MNDLIKTNSLEINQIARALKELGLSADYETPVKNYSDFISQNGREIGPVSLSAYLKNLFKRVQSGEASARTYNKTLTANRRFILAYFQAVGKDAHRARQILTGTEFKQIKVENTVEGKGVLTPEEMKLLETLVGERTKMIIQFLRITALRVSEAINAAIKNCHEEKDGIYIQVIGKGKKERTVFISKKFYRKLQEVFSGEKFLLETINHKKYDRRNIYRMIRQASKYSKSGKRIHPHAFRHAWATNALKGGADLHAVSQYLGHASIETTSKFYLHKKPTAKEVLKFKV